MIKFKENINIVVILFVFCFLCACTPTNYNTNAAPVYYNVATAKTPNMEKGSNTKYIAVPVQGQLMHKPTKSGKKSARLVGPDAVVEANKKALRQANSGNYFNSIMTYDYMDGALYQIYSEPLKVTDVQFQTGERIISVAAGDTMRWQVSKTYSGGELIVKNIS